MTEGRQREFFIVDAGGLRLCVDRVDGEIHIAGGTDPVIGFKVASLDPVLAALAGLGLDVASPVQEERGRYAILRDPDGRPVILTEVD